MAELEALRSELRSPRLETRESAIKAVATLELRQLGDELLALFRREEATQLKGLCAWALGRLHHRPALKELVQGLQDGDAEVRQWSAWALGEIGLREAETALRRALEREKTSEVRRAIGGALKKHALESTRVFAGKIEKELKPPLTKEPEIARIVSQLSSLQWPEQSNEILSLREQLLRKDPVYFKAYMQWLRRRPALLDTLNNDRKVYRD